MLSRNTPATAMNLEHASKSAWLVSLMAARSCSCRRLVASFRASSGNASVCVNVSLCSESDRLCIPTLPRVWRFANSGSAVASEYRPVHVELLRRPQGSAERCDGPAGPCTLVSDEALDEALDMLPPPPPAMSLVSCRSRAQTTIIFKKLLPTRHTVLEFKGSVCDSCFCQISFDKMSFVNQAFTRDIMVSCRRKTTVKNLSHIAKYIIRIIRKRLLCTFDCSKHKDKSSSLN